MFDWLRTLLGYPTKAEVQQGFDEVLHGMTFIEEDRLEKLRSLIGLTLQVDAEEYQIRGATIQTLAVWCLTPLTETQILAWEDRVQEFTKDMLEPGTRWPTVKYKRTGYCSGYKFRGLWPTGIVVGKKARGAILSFDTFEKLPDPPPEFKPEPPVYKAA